MNNGSSTAQLCVKRRTKPIKGVNVVESTSFFSFLRQHRITTLPQKKRPKMLNVALFCIHPLRLK